MLKRGLVLVMSFAMVSPAFAGATVDFVVTDFGNTPCSVISGCSFGDSGANPDGTFNGGEQILVHVMVTASQDMALRGAQIDWRASSPELILGQDVDTVNQPIDGIPNFWFDYSNIVIIIPGVGTFAKGTYPASGQIGEEPNLVSTTGGYADFSNLQQGFPLIDFVAETLWIQTSESPGMLRIEAGVPYRLGGMPVTLPADCGDYTLDVLNLPNTDDSNAGMVLDFGFGSESDPIMKWASALLGQGVDDVITYANGPLTLSVVGCPPPPCEGVECRTCQVCVDGVCVNEPDCCGNRTCDGDEDCANCPEDCNGATCDDGFDCTEGDICLDGICSGIPDDRFCDDRIFCNGVEKCTPGPGVGPSGCTASGCPAGTINDCLVTGDCDEDNDLCLPPAPDDSLCEAGQFCTLEGFCHCEHGPVPEDLDHDGDVDLHDHAILQAAFTGPQ
ncbi:MAG: hypothetical protein IID42_04470 [Planctomycetes bacterium]|nr:hypothetical protein [Planctomycetota bacterium]